MGLAYAGDVNESKREKDAEVRLYINHSGNFLNLTECLQIGACLKFPRARINLTVLLRLVGWNKVSHWKMRQSIIFYYFHF